MASVERLLDEVYEAALHKETPLVMPYFQGRIER